MNQFYLKGNAMSLYRFSCLPFSRYSEEKGLGDEEFDYGMEFGIVLRLCVIGKQGELDLIGFLLKSIKRLAHHSAPHPPTPSPRVRGEGSSVFVGYVL